MKKLFFFAFLSLTASLSFAQTETPGGVPAPDSNSVPPPATTEPAVPVAPTPPPAFPKTDWDAGERPTPSLDVARFRWWAPENAKDLRGVMIIIPGRRGDTRGAVDSPDWRAFAEQVRFALIGMQLDKGDGAYQNDPDGQTTGIIEKAIEKLAVDNGFPQLKSAPLAFWGHSAGSNTLEHFATRNPKRIVAMVSIKGPSGPGDYNKDKGDIPFLICTGAKDNPEWVKSSADAYEIGRDKKALWTKALQSHEGHEEGKTKEFAILYLTTAINARMDAPMESVPPSKHLKDLNPNSGWLGDPKTFEIAAYTDFKGKKKEAVWIPDEETAKAWKTYMQQ